MQKALSSSPQIQAPRCVLIGRVHVPAARTASRRPAGNTLRRVTTNIAAQQQPDYTTELRNAEKRWEDQIREGKVKSVIAKTAGELLKDGWTFLDVRPRHEVERVSVEGAVEIPIYVVDEEVSLVNFLKKSSNFGLGGWWLGGTHMKPNDGFLAAVQNAVPKDARVVVACQKGLRSLAAAEQLSRAGYGTLAWVNGGLDTAKKADLPIKGQFDDMRYAGIGGLSELLGWTDVQREKAAGFLGGSDGAIKLAVAVLVLDGLWVAYDKVNELLAAKGGP